MQECFPVNQTMDSLLQDVKENITHGKHSRLENRKDDQGLMLGISCEAGQLSYEDDLR